MTPADSVRCVEPRYVVVVGVHAVVALAFIAVAVRNAILGDVVFAVMQGVIATLLVILGVGIARAV